MAPIVSGISKLLAEKATDDVLRTSARPRPFASSDFAKPRASTVANDAAIIHTSGTPSAVAADIAYGPKPSLVRPKPSLDLPKKTASDRPKPSVDADQTVPSPTAADIYYPAADVYVPASDEAPSAYDRKKK